MKPTNPIHKPANQQATCFLGRLMLAASLVFLAASPAQAWQHQSPDSIRAAIVDYIAMRYGDDPDIQVEIGHIDKRLKLSRCPQPLVVEQPDGARQLGNTSVEVRCRGNNSWRIYVSVRIRKYAEVLVSRHALPRGTYLQPSDVSLERRDISRLNNGYFTLFEEIREMVARRNLRQGTLLTPSLVSPPRLVKRGDTITIMAKSGNLQIRVKGKALMDGRKGDTIKVRNTRSRREIEATVVASGLVRVNI